MSDQSGGSIAKGDSEIRDDIKTMQLGANVARREAIIA
jgi:hypothetical protein